MPSSAVRLRDRYYDSGAHPYRIFDRRVEPLIRPDTRVLLDADCGRSAPVLYKFICRVERLIRMCYEKLISRVEALRFFAAGTS